MALADANVAKIAIAPEVTYGVNPASGAVATRFTGENLVLEIPTTTSKEIRSDRLPAGVIRTGLSAKGDINFEFSATTFDTLIQGAMMSTWSSALAIGPASISATAAGHFTSTALFGSVAVGQWIKVAGFVSAFNNGFFRVIAKTSSSDITVDSATMVTEAGSGDETIGGSFIRTGTTKQSFTVEKQLTDVNVFELFLGMMVDKFSLTVQANSILTGQVTFLGKSKTNFTTSQIGTVGAASTSLIANAIDNVAGIREAVLNADSTLSFTDLSWAVGNNLRPKPAIGVLGSIEVGLGKVEVTGAMKAYIVDKTMLDKYDGFTTDVLAFRVFDANNKAYVFTFPSVKFSKGASDVTGENTDVFADMGFIGQAATLADASTLVMQIDRF